MKPYPAPNAGFTLVELITVLILIGILSAVGVGLFLGKGSVSALAARDQLIAAALLAQQRALAVGGTGTPVRLTVTQLADGSDWAFTITPFPPAGLTRTAERAGASLKVDGTLLADGDSVSFAFDESGQEVGANHEFVFSANSTHTACLASTGFAYALDCQP